MGSIWVHGKQTPARLRTPRLPFPLPIALTRHDLAPATAPHRSTDRAAPHPTRAPRTGSGPSRFTSSITA